MSFIRRIAVPVVSGALLAIPIGLLVLLGLGSLLRVAVGPGPSLVRIWHFVGRNVVFLLAAGAVSGLLNLRDSSRRGRLPRTRQLLAFTYVALPLAFAFAMAFGSLQYARFWFGVLRPQFDPSSTEEQVRARLGTPARELRTPSEFRTILFAPCEPQRAACALAYSDPHGNSYRVLYFDAAGHYLCDNTGRIW